MHRQWPDEQDHDASMLPTIAWSGNFRTEKINRGINMKWKDKGIG